MRLDEDKLETLRRWGEALRQASSEEHAAVGRAILMLIEEIEQLRLDLRHVRQQLSQRAALSSDEAAADPEEPFASTLHERLQRVLTRDSDSLSARIEPKDVEEAGSGVESDRTTRSPQSWIQALRRQK